MLWSARSMFHAPVGGIAMGRKVRLARSKILVSRESLQRKFSELQQLKEQIRLAEIAAKQRPPREEDCGSERPHAVH